MSTYTYEQIDPRDLSATDLRKEAERADHCEAYVIRVYDEYGRPAPETAEALVVDDARIGIAWGADAGWADYEGDIDEAIDCWLNRPDDWAARN